MSSDFRFDPLEVRGSGQRIIETAGVNLANRQLVRYNAAGQIVLADASALATLPCMGITLAAATAGQQIEVLLKGFLGLSTWAWTPGDMLYVSNIAGALGALAGTTAQRVAVVNTATQIWFDPKGLDTGVGGPVCALLEGHTAYVGFDVCKGTNYTNYWTVNGVADDVQVQLAVDYVEALGGGSIFLETGTYSFTAIVDIIVSPNVMITGAGYDDTEITQPNGTNLAQFFDVTQNNTHFSRIYLNGNQANNINTVGIEYTGVTDGRVEFMKIRYMPASGVYAHGACVRFRLLNSVLRDNVGYNLWLQASSDSFIQGNTITGATLSGAFIDNCVGVKCEGNQVLVNVERGINCSISNFVNINSNIVNANGLAAIRIASANPSYGKWNTVEGNICFDNSQTTPNTFHGIYLDGVEVQNNIIIGNVSYGSDQMYGIAENQATENIIENNFVRGNSTGGLFIGAGSSAHNNFVDGTSTINADGEVKELWFGVKDCDSFIGNHPALRLTDLTATDAINQIYVPLDFQELVEAHVIVVPGGTGDFRRGVDTSFGKLCNEDYDADSDLIAASEVAVVANALTCFDISAALTGLAAGDLVGVKFARFGAHVDDTVDADCYYLGIRVRYI